MIDCCLVGRELKGKPTPGMVWRSASLRVGGSHRITKYEQEVNYESRRTHP
jgi:hypothetical protein